ncbi:hypothetical protein [Actinoplanes couchii]|uniref:hypothetical protein n=1 Tax=Actinoplanes couchii TaxID=403638 RepID=UPI001EF38B5C|nr:hypothetical protein [Actinoplanes couchii]MDR6320893.1 hypothetical protein [Actinoplanes couchii]
MNDDLQRPSPMRGLWALTIGGLVLAGLLVALDPVMTVEDCPNYGGNGNASIFENEAWDLYLPALLLLWMASTVVEPFVPHTRRGRGDTTARALISVSLSVVGSCFIGGLLLTCH